MDNLLNTVDELRRMSAAELADVGEDSLKVRLREQGQEARDKHGPLSPSNIETILSDPDCVRHPTRLVLEFGEMSMHQFAHPDVDVRDETGRGRVIYLRPALGKRPDLMALAVSYMIPVINYGDKMIGDEHCQVYGASIMGLSEKNYYNAICDLAEFVGAEERMSDGAPESNHQSSGHGCGCGSGGCGS
jgi:hypothetical protein